MIGNTIETIIENKYEFLIGVGSLIFLKAAHSLRLMFKRKQKIKAARAESTRQAERKRDERAKAIEEVKLCESSEIVKNAIDEATLYQIHNDLMNGKYSSLELLSELIRRTIDVGVRYNFVSDVNFKWALNRAEECDREREQAKKEGREVGLLHGIPISVKDQIYVKGTSSNWCHSHNLYPLVEEDAAIIKILKQAGVIPFVKSTTPVAASIQTHSYVWGQARNPLNPNRSPGGSSGGEGGLVASRCSILGLGSDSAGSVRIPAALCGTAGFYPTANRMPYGKYGGMFGESAKNALQIIKSVPGPLAKRVDDIEAFLRIAMSDQAYDISRFSVPQPYDMNIAHSTKKLRIGYVIDNDLFALCPSSRRAVLMAKGALEKRGHQVVPFELGSLKKLMICLLRLFSIDQGKSCAECLIKEPGDVVPVKLALDFANMSKRGIYFVQRYLRRKKDRLADFIIPETDGEQHTLDLIDKRDYTEQFFEKMMGRYKSEQIGPRFDALLTPAFPYPAPPCDVPRGFMMSIAFMSISNLFQMPAGVVPVTTVQDGEELWDPVKNGGDPDDTLAAAARLAMENSISLPMAVQIAALPYHDEIAIRLLREVEEEVKYFEKHPFLK